ncbi:4'-phosphopantetheinyl transferase superfamily protein [Bradyrhizobium sp. WYCCWR 13023]|uniref:Enterobactin synthase component D n=1 Tax=Bradyrhizobium zhengyangense TaxID=2911009 RepID=A0A9X1RKC5_9BRAD|nr:4'-phosphopantetheinyl transferase superfamily protein [Bradyrhizobium zhengyangense]MCG2632723.1 4'-phosphopantetheinyl transferase superfamily protein [Bradyrhizobium zhengyangense]
MPAIDCIWRRLLPDCIAVSAGSGAISVSRHYEERSGIAMGDRRRSEFLAGRAHAHAALTELGVSDLELPTGPDRAPLWPDGIRGSITHASKHDCSYVAAAVGRSEVLRGIGIDVEFISAIRPQAWRQFLTARELEFVRKLSIGDRARSTAAIWCAKEAGIKAISQILEPCSIEVLPLERLSDAVQHWSLKRLDSPEDHFPLQARTACLDDLAFAAVTLPRSIGERLNIKATIAQPTIRTEGTSNGLGYRHG